MQKLNINLEYCYGIKKFQDEFDFSGKPVIAIYASNGMMKTSFAKTFRDVSNDESPKDIIYEDQPTICEIRDENNKEIDRKSIFVVDPYVELNIQDKIKPILVNRRLQEKYTDIHKKIDEKKGELLTKLKELSGLKKDDIEDEIKKWFDNDDFFKIFRDNKKIIEDTSSQIGNIEYKKIFNEKFLNLLEDDNFQNELDDYMKKYHSLLEKSKYFKQGFDYFSGENIKDQLEKYGFFNTDHLIQFNSKDEKIEIKNKNDLQRIIDAEKQSILDNDELKTTWDKISSILHKNEQLRITHNYLRDNVKILQKLADPKEFAKEVWFSYFIDCKDLINSLLKEYESGKEEIKQIVEEAQKEHETWKNVITLYNERFSVPFRINIKNQSDVILNNAEIPIIEFEFRDSTGKIKVEESTLYSVLGTGEKKALHILNIIFEVEARKENKQETLFIIDDIVDSFDYKNKYAIIQYLKEISEVPHFKLIILTHNFDFFRTINHKGIVERPKSYFVYKNAKGIKLEKAIGVNNIFIKDILKNLNNKRKIIASIPFARNIIEYTKGIEDDDYRKLTSLLHFKEDTDKILLSDLKSILGRNFSIPKEDLGNDTDHKIVDLIFNEAEKCSKNNTEGINFENKIVLAIGIRLKAEQYVISKINDNDFVSSITKHQTHKLIDKYKEKFPTESENIKILNAVNLMTPENIHLNSFMYEPILDMSDIDLKNLYCKVSQMTA